MNKERKVTFISVIKQTWWLLLICLIISLPYGFYNATIEANQFSILSMNPKEGFNQGFIRALCTVWGVYFGLIIGSFIHQKFFNRKK